MSSLALVLLLLILGSLMLSGLNQRQRTHALRAVSESRALRSAASVQSAMEWARVQVWQTQPALQCRQENSQGWRACLRILSDQTVLLIAGSGSDRLWRLGEIGAGRVTLSRHGWSDFCPQTEASLCQLP